jgi:cysteine protease ATG4
MVIESPDDVIFIGGTPYGIKVHKNEAMKDVKHAIEEENKKLRNDIESTIWFSYRSGWKRYLPGTKLDGDVGWGCMIRCGQMMIAKAAQKSANDRSDHLNKQLIDLCNDEGSSELSPFSLFGLVDYASQTFSVQPGQWFRATTIMMSLEHMNKVHNPPLTNHIAIHTSVDSVVEPKELFFRALPSRAAEKNDDPKYYIQALSTSTWEKELLLCVAVRTGLNKPQANFKDCLAELISLPQAVGFLGGRDSKAYFVIGMLILTQGYNKRKEKYYYLDPHYVQVSIVSNAGC